MALMRKYKKRPTFKKRRPYMRRRLYRSKKYTGVKYFTERIQFPNLDIQPGQSSAAGWTNVTFNDLTNAPSIKGLFDLFSIVSLKYEIRPINTYSFGSSPVPAPNITYAIEENPDSWVASSSKAQIMDKATSKTRTMDNGTTNVINVYQKLPQCSSSQMGGPAANDAVTTLSANRNKFKWYSIPDISMEQNTPGFGALRYWLDIPNNQVVPGQGALQVAEQYVTIRYCCKSQQ